MGTRATITIKKNGKSAKFIFSQSDGYLNHLGVEVLKIINGRDNFWQLNDSEMVKFIISQYKKNNRKCKMQLFEGDGHFPYSSFEYLIDLDEKKLSAFQVSVINETCIDVTKKLHTVYEQVIENQGEKICH